MAFLLCIARFVLVSVVSLTAFGALPAAAQFNPFEALFGSPPRPPSGVPGGRQQPPPQQQAVDNGDLPPPPEQTPPPSQAKSPPIVAAARSTLPKALKPLRKKTEP